MVSPLFTVCAADWQTCRVQLHAIRRTVFIEEQRVPAELEWDEIDEHCHHALASDDDGAPIGTGRLTPNGQIGRMAVLKQWRRRGVGDAILEFLIDVARKQGFRKVCLHAQMHALGFYAKHGFGARGRQFMEAGIPHRLMMLSLRRLSGRKHL